MTEERYRRSTDRDNPAIEPVSQLRFTCAPSPPEEDEHIDDDEDGFGCPCCLPPWPTQKTLRGV